MEKIYDISDKSGDNLYRQMSTVVDGLMEKSEELRKYAKMFEKFAETEYSEYNMTENEYMFEMIMIGVYWKNYRHTAANVSDSVLKAAGKILKLKNKGKIGRFIYNKTIGVVYDFYRLPGKKRKVIPNKRNYEKVVKLFQTIDDYKYETDRLSKWGEFMYKNRNHFDLLMAAAKYSSLYMDKMEEKFGDRFANLEKFRSESATTKRFKEDYLLTQKNTDEYYLNIIGAEIMNREMKKEFSKKKKKIIILPACLSANKGTLCGKREEKGLYKCTGCSSICQVKEITGKYPETFIVPHSTDFRAAVKRLKSMGNTGVLGVACIQNLMEGGYGLKKAGIVSQCAILKYPGCSHFYDNPVTTAVSIEEIDKIME